MSAEPSTPEARRRGIVGPALRWLGLLAATGFVGLLTYGLMARAHVIGAITSEQLRAGIAAARSGRLQPAAPGGEQLPTRSA